MCCWNGTCAISNLPILDGDPIVLIPLVSLGNKLKDGVSCYVTDKYTPLSLPIYGEYNDCGGIKNIKTSSYNKNYLEGLNFYEQKNDEVDIDELIEAYKKSPIKRLNSINTKILDIKKCESININNYKDLNELLNDFIKEQFIVEYKNYESNKKYTNYMMIHKKLYNMLITETGNRIPYEGKKNYKTLWIEKIKKFVTNKDFDEYKSLSEQLGLDQGQITYSKSLYEDIISNLINKWDSKLANELVNMILFKKSLELLRKGYLIDTGLGSQSMEYRLHKIIADFINEYISNYVRNFLTENEDDIDVEDIVREKIYWRN